ncbi:hypothetical protein L484_002940 [Morus notabilis]|uniref:BHLH domain-containing protein n=1 Tax=Morus notabilis TaxID=981085 RepID=W9QTC8_9ROSA|nr:hypothetical protein L484_002940 [Morus notabilis]
MQPCSREMQGMSSLLNASSSQISLEDLQQQQSQSSSSIQGSQIHQIHASHYEPPPSHDDFLEQMLSTLGPPSWADLGGQPGKVPWDTTTTVPDGNGPNNKPRDDETPDNVPAFPFDESANLASKFRNHQISGGCGSKSAAAAAAAMMLQHQLMLARGGGAAGAGETGLVPMPLSLSNGEFDRSQNDVVDGSSSDVTLRFKHCTMDSALDLWPALVRRRTSFTILRHAIDFGGSMAAQQNYGASGPAMNQTQAPSGSSGAQPAQPRPRVRARRGQATDPHSIAERLRRERIAERMKALQELVPNANKTDKASMLDEIIDYVKFLQLQVKVLSMSRLGGAAAVAPLVADMSPEGNGGDCIQANSNGGTHGRTSNGNTNNNQTASSNDTMTVTEHQVAKLMEEDMGSAMQYLQGKGLCLMPISLATAISTATCHTRNPMINNNHHHPPIGSNGEGPSSPSMSVLTVQSATTGNGAAAADGSVKDAASVSQPW